MEPWIGLVYLRSQIILVSCNDVRVGTFQNLHRHPKLRSCAVEVLKENSCVGGRVHKLTGACECLNHSWGINQAVQGGYAYTKIISAEDSFNPPINVIGKTVCWTMPGILRKGATVEVTLTSETKDTLELNVYLVDTLDGFEPFSPVSQKFVRFGYSPHDEETKNVFLWEFDGGQYLQQTETVIPLKLSNVTKISFKSLSDRLQTSVNDQTMLLRNMTLDLKSFRHIALAFRFRGIDLWSVTQINRIGFIDG